MVDALFLWFIWVNKLYDLKYDGKKIIDIEYDSYSNPNAFIPSQPEILSKIIKRDYHNAIANYNKKGCITNEFYGGTEV